MDFKWEFEKSENTRSQSDVLGRHGGKSIFLHHCYSMLILKWGQHGLWGVKPAAESCWHEEHFVTAVAGWQHHVRDSHRYRLGKGACCYRNWWRRGKCPISRCREKCWKTRHRTGFPPSLLWAARPVSGSAAVLLSFKRHNTMLDCCCLIVQSFLQYVRNAKARKLRNNDRSQGKVAGYLTGHCHGNSAVIKLF